MEQKKICSINEADYKVEHCTLYEYIYIDIKLNLFFNDQLKTIRQCFILTSKKNSHSIHFFLLFIYTKEQRIYDDKLNMADYLLTT